MQHNKLSSRCIESNLLGLNEHLLSANFASNCSAPPDDVQIATGQASFDDGDSPDEMSTWINSYGSHGMVEDSDDVLAVFDYSPTQAHSAPARGWDIGGFEGFDSCAALQYEGSSSLEESEPWSHLQTLALSAPEHDVRSSQRFQIDFGPQNPSSWQGNDLQHPISTKLRHQHQFPTEHKRMQANPYYVEGNLTQHSKRHNYDRTARGLHHPTSSFQDTTLHTIGQQMTDSSTSSRFAQATTSGMRMENNSTQFSDPQPAYALHHPNHIGMKKSHTGLSQSLELNSSFDRGLIGEPGHSSFAASQDVISPHEHLWQLNDHFHIEHQSSTSADTDYGFSGYEFTTHDPAWSRDIVQDPPLGFADSSTIDHPGAIKIGGSSRHYKPDLPSSFPPSAYCYPDHMPMLQNRAASSTSEPIFHPSSPPNLPSRRNSMKSPSARASRSGSLSIIREYGHPQHGSPNMSRNSSGKGKRKGPLPTATALAAAQKRKDGSVCIRCRTMKMTCKGGLPCEGCRQITKMKLWDQTCTPANFTDMVKEGPCNAIFQHTISHLALDGSRRLVVAVPTAFNVSRLLDRLEPCHSRYDIRVRHSSGGSYTLDLSNCLKTLTRIHKSCGLEICELQDFVKNKQSRLAWLQSVREYDLAASVVDRSIQWNSMPSKNSYNISPHSTSMLGYALNIEDQHDRGTIIFAAQLCRIILRALEIEAFDALQKSVNELTKGGKSDEDIETLIGQLGRILVSLRWRVSWWAVIGDSPDEAFSCRVQKIAQILHCYYFVARKKLSPSSRQLPSRIYSVYPDVQPVYEDLPVTDSLEGFHAWMQHGQAVVQEANSLQSIARSLPTAPTNPHF